MRHNDVSLRQIFQRRLIDFVQLVELFCPFLIICLIVCAMLRIRLRKRCANVLHFLLCVHRVQPDVGVVLAVLVGVMTVRCGDNSVVGGIVFMRGRIAHSGVFFIRMIVTVLISMRGPMVMAVLFGLMVVTVLFLCAAQQAHSLRRFHGNQFFIGKPRQNVRNPVLHPSTVIDKNVRLLHPGNILCGRLPVVGLCAGRHHAGHLDVLAANFLCEIVHRIKTRHHLQLVGIHRFVRSFRAAADKHCGKQ